MFVDRRRLVPALVVTMMLIAGSVPLLQPGRAHARRASERLARSSLRPAETDESFYFVMPDRFFNGKPGNDNGGLEGGPLETGLDPTHKGFYHGGDLAGLIKKLDYIKSLGTTAIWMTPSFKNRPVQGLGTEFVSAGYHGYWITDFTRIDPHLGSNRDLRRLVEGAHARGMKLYFDIITNHTADVIAYEEGVYDYVPKSQEPYRDAEGNVFDDRDYAGTEDFPPLDPAVSFPYTPVFPNEDDATVKKPGWLNNRIYYHNRGNTTFVGEDSLYGDFFGLDDLFTEHPRVVNGMIDIYNTWIGDYGIDGFRIDTAKHVNNEFWQEFSPAILRHAHRAGVKNFFAFGEVFDSNPEYLSTFPTEAKFQAVLDFGFQSQARDFAGKSVPTYALADFFAKDDLYTDHNSNAYQLPTFLGNHDMGRIAHFIAEDNPDATEAEILKRDRLAHKLMYFSRGNPVIYYGDEQGFNGDGGDQDAREDMFPSRVATYNDNNLIGTDETTAENNFDRDHPLFRTISRLAAVTKRYPALRNGAQQHRVASEGAGVYAFSRIDARKQIEYVVALNNSESDKLATIPTFSADMPFERVWPRRGAARQSESDKGLSLRVPALSAVVYKAGKRLASRAAAPEVIVGAPAEGAEVRERVEVAAEVSGDGFNQVSFAVKVDDAEEWRYLGTDDNRPYRVFYDVSDLEPGTRLTFKSVVLDSSGNTSSDTGTAVVAPPPPEG